MPDIVLATLNAKYIHSAFGLRYLMANLGSLRPRAAMVEFDINQRPIDVLEAILAQNPKIVGLGVYIWNVEPATKLVADLKRVRPDVVVIVGGPEVSYEMDQQEICRLADYVITGEADLAFADLCRGILDNRRPQKVVLSGSNLLAPSIADRVSDPCQTRFSVPNVRGILHICSSLRIGDLRRYTQKN